MVNISFFQIDKNTKKIIATDMTFDNILTLTDDQYNGGEPI